MKRREVIQKLVYTVPAGMAFPSLLSSCAQNKITPTPVYGGNVIVIGAGASVLAGVWVALVNVRGAGRTRIAGRTRAGEATDAVYAGSPVAARVWLAVVDVRCAGRTRIARRAGANEAIHAAGATAPVIARVRRATFSLNGL